MTRFYCSYYWGEGEREDWGGKITRIQSFGSHYEIFIQSRSSILLMLGRTTTGVFACIPDRQAGCWLSSPDDIRHNSEKLSNAIDNLVDGITVAYAYKALSDIISLK
ncbi:MAG: hypothetical protein ACOX5W_08240 [Bacillota bacterium]|jgi:hypothetical protein